MIRKFKTNIFEKIKLLNYYNRKNIIDDNISKITDTSYDLLKKEILELEKNYNYLKNHNSPSISVGHKPSKNFKKVTT
jgi:DNA ligase (NAD+)